MLKIEQSGIAQKSTKSNEWYTPGYIIEAAREVMGSIELDPASCALAQETVRAERYFTKEDDGLSQEWRAKTVWLNPPYSYENKQSGMNHTGLQPSITKQWINKLEQEYTSGNVSQAILLVKADPKQNWFSPLWSQLICFMPDRVFFSRPEGIPEKHMFGTALVYYGENWHDFIDVFSRLGTVVKRVS